MHKEIVFACDLHLFIFYLDDEIVTLVSVTQIVKLLMMWKTKNLDFSVEIQMKRTKDKLHMLSFLAQQ